MPKQRLDAMSDGVFAVAMTLLALDLGIPLGLPPTEVSAELAQLAPRFYTYALAFGFIGVVWIYLQHFQHLLLRYDLFTITISLLASGGIILLPFTSSTAAAYPASPAAQRLFSFNFAAIVLMYSINTLYSIWCEVPRVVDRRFLQAFAIVVWTFEAYLGILVPILVGFRPTWGIPAIGGMVVVAYLSMWFMHPHFAAAYHAILQDGSTAPHGELDPSRRSGSLG